MYVYIQDSPSRSGVFPAGWRKIGMPQGKNFQSPSSGSMRVIPNERNIYFVNLRYTLVPH